MRAIGSAGVPAVATAVEAGGTPAACYAQHRFLSGGTAAGIFRGPHGGKGELRTVGRLRQTAQPALALPDGTAVALADTAPPTLRPEVGLAVYDMSSLVIIGSVPIAGAKHGQSIQRPLSVISLQAATGCVGGFQACVLAIERLVVVFSWRLGMGSEAISIGGISISIISSN